MRPKHRLLLNESRVQPARAPTILRRLGGALDHAVGTAARGRFEQAIYSLAHLNLHFQSVAVELERLGAFLAAHGVAAQSALDVGCGDGAISVRLQRMLGLPEIAGVELTRKRAGEARSRGVSVSKRTWMPCP
jgi:2-polyprenyl-3-methyl-5-hydroxy-6-metoxy-1,4-benzoquinol methylase